MDGREIYEAHREQAERLAPLDRGIAPLQPWDELDWRLRAQWEKKAAEQAARDKGV